MTAAPAASRKAPAVRLLWSGRPQRGAYVLRLWWRPALIAAAIGAFGVVWEGLTLTGHHSIVYPLAGSAFFLLAAYGLAVRPLLLLRVARRLRYEVTERDVVWRDEGGKPTFGLRGDRLPEAAVVGWRRFTDVVFFTAPERYSPWGLWRLREDRARFVCLSPEEARAALAAVEELWEKRGGAPSS
jgi:hypothetical protein